MKNRLILLTLTLVFAVHHSCFAADNGREKAIPDFTKGDKIPEDAKHDWNLGATGLRGWIYCDKMVTSDARQIAITKVEKGSPTDGVLAIGDVILGVGGKPFSYDPRTEMGKALTLAESEVGKGNLTLTRWRAGNSAEVVVKLPVLGTYSATAPYNCPKSKRILEHGCQDLARRMAYPTLERLRLLSQHHIEEGMNALVIYTRDQNPWESQIRTPELMKILLTYGTHAKVVIPELIKISHYFEKEEKERGPFPFLLPLPFHFLLPLPRP
jgi:hypothetical protein